jgi:hypothetical protein
LGLSEILKVSLGNRIQVRSPRWSCHMRRFASAILIVGLMSAVSGCVVRTRGHVRVRPAVVVVDPAPVGVVVVQSEPPPPRYVQVQPRSGFFWVQGRWDWRGNQWIWIDGHWERAPHVSPRPVAAPQQRLRVDRRALVRARALSRAANDRRRSAVAFSTAGQAMFGAA